MGQLSCYYFQKQNHKLYNINPIHKQKHVSFWGCFKFFMLSLKWSNFYGLKGVKMLLQHAHTNAFSFFPQLPQTLFISNICTHIASFCFSKLILSIASVFLFSMFLSFCFLSPFLDYYVSLLLSSLFLFTFTVSSLFSMCFSVCIYCPSLSLS